jgi:hypothetical protein
MKLGNFIKSPVERKRYEIDYSDWLDTGETLSTVTFAVTPVETSGLTINGNSIPSPSTSVYFYANAGVAGSNYVVDVQATTSGGQIKEDTVLFSVRSA